MLLRQTSAPAVSKLWLEFTQKYPDARALANANKHELFAQLQILGLAEQRSSALLAASKWLVQHHNGQVPSTKEELDKIPHVGMYVIHAVLCFAFDQDVAIVDTNVLRFYSRYHGLDVKPDIRRNPGIWEIAELSLPPGQAKEHNYGLLDFTAGVCTSRKPRCSSCPLADSCSLGSQGLAK